MKHVLIILPLLFILSSSVYLNAQDEELLYIEWFGDDDVANHLTRSGMMHFVNIEREKAYTYFEAAVEKDPTLFAPHVALAWMSDGDKKSYHKIQAQKLVKGKNEVSRTFVSTLDIPEGKEGAPQWKKAWAKMHELGHDGAFIHFQYALSLDEPSDQIMALKKLKEKSMSQNRGVGHIHNILGYLYYAEGDKEKGKAHFEKYIAQYPEGYNAYDSMGEYYRNEGDLKNALKYYQKAKEKYPAAVSATNAIKEIKAEMKEGGNLIEVVTEYVSPQNMTEYVEWGQKYKAVADKTNFKDFYVDMQNGSFSYASFVGKDLTDVQAANQEWEDWHNSNPELKEMYEKYKHTVSTTEKKLWRHSPQYSYSPEGYASSDVPTYTRVYQGYVKFGHVKEVKALLDEFKNLWTEANISYPYNVYWNVYGEKGPCVVFRSTYKNIEGWASEQKEVSEKVGEAKLNDILKRWNNQMRKWENHESFPRADMTHINGQPLAAND